MNVNKTFLNLLKNMPTKKPTRKKAAPKQTRQRTVYVLWLTVNGRKVPTTYDFTDRRKAVAKAKALRKAFPGNGVAITKMANPYRRKN